MNIELMLNEAIVIALETAFIIICFAVLDHLVTLSARLSGISEAIIISFEMIVVGILSLAIPLLICTILALAERHGLTLVPSDEYLLNCHA